MTARRESTDEEPLSPGDGFAEQVAKTEWKQPPDLDISILFGPGVVLGILSVWALASCCHRIYGIDTQTTGWYLGYVAGVILGPGVAMILYAILQTSWLDPSWWRSALRKLETWSKTAHGKNLTLVFFLSEGIETENLTQDFGLGIWTDENQGKRKRFAFHLETYADAQTWMEQLARIVQDAQQSFSHTSWYLAYRLGDHFQWMIPFEDAGANEKLETLQPETRAKAAELLGRFARYDSRLNAMPLLAPPAQANASAPDSTPKSVSQHIEPTATLQPHHSLDTDAVSAEQPISVQQEQARILDGVLSAPWTTVQERKGDVFLILGSFVAFMVVFQIVVMFLGLLLPFLLISWVNTILLIMAVFGGIAFTYKIISKKEARRIQRWTTGLLGRLSATSQVPNVDVVLRTTYETIKGKVAPTDVKTIGVGLWPGNGQSDPLCTVTLDADSTEVVRDVCDRVLAVLSKEGRPKVRSLWLVSLSAGRLVRMEKLDPSAKESPPDWPEDHREMALALLEMYGQTFQSSS